MSVSRETICEQNVHCLSCPLCVLFTGKQCEDLTDKEIEYILKEVSLND